MKKTVVVFCSQTSNEKELNERYGKYHILNTPRINEVECIKIFSNTKSLPKKYNEWIKNEDYNIVLVHDDVLINDKEWLEKIDDNLKKYDVIGLAGASSAKISEPCLWHLMSPREDHKGKVSHVSDSGKGTFVTYFGKHGRVLILDGLFLAFNSKRIYDASAFFDESNPCVAHFYDIDFSLTCKSKKLKLGTVDINAIHNSHGLRSFTDEWLSGQVWFLDKVKNGKYLI